jgi:hypothetical protein
LAPWQDSSEVCMAVVQLPEGSGPWIQPPHAGRSWVRAGPQRGGQLAHDHSIVAFACQERAASPSRRPGMSDRESRGQAFTRGRMSDPWVRIADGPPALRDQAEEDATRLLFWGRGITPCLGASGQRLKEETDCHSSPGGPP